MDKTAQLKAKIERLRRKKTALLTQSRLLQDFVSLAKSSAKEQMLTAILQKTLELTAELSKAETGSLFLLDPDGVVRDCILTLLHSQPGIFHQGTVDRLPANFTMGSCCRTAAWPSSSEMSATRGSAHTAIRECLRLFAWGSSTRRPGCWHRSMPGICRW